MSAIVRRLREPSTWAGFAALLVAFGLPTPFAEQIATTGASVAALVAMLLPERNGR